MTIRRARSPAEVGPELRDILLRAGLAPKYADLLHEMPHKAVHIDSRRPFREAGVARDEVMVVRSGIIAKFKSDGSGRRQIVALRFPGEGILPRSGKADYGVAAILKSEVMVGQAADFDPIVEANPELRQFFWKLIQRNEAI